MSTDARQSILPAASARATGAEDDSLPRAIRGTVSAVGADRPDRPLGRRTEQADRESCGGAHLTRSPEAYQRARLEPTAKGDTTMERTAPDTEIGRAHV